MRRVLAVLFLLAAVLGSVSESAPAPASAAAAVPSWAQCVDHYSGDWGTLSHTCQTYPMSHRAGQMVYGHWMRIVWPSGYTRITTTYPTFTQPAPAPVYPALPACIWPAVRQWTIYIDQAAAITGIPARVIAGDIETESTGNPNVSSLGGDGADIGLMQYGPAEAAVVQRTYGYGAYTYDPRLNILTGAGYLRYLQQYYAGGSLYTALAMFNGGMGNPRYGYAALVWARSYC